jgi:hypothetical protein
MNLRTRNAHPCGRKSWILQCEWALFVIRLSSNRPSRYRKCVGSCMTPRLFQNRESLITRFSEPYSSCEAPGPSSACWLWQWWWATYNIWSHPLPLPLEPLSYTMYIGISTMRPLRSLTTFRISTTQDLIWELWQRLSSAGGKRHWRVV